MGERQDLNERERSWNTEAILVCKAHSAVTVVLHMSFLVCRQIAAQMDSHVNLSHDDAMQQKRTRLSRACLLQFKG